MTRPLRLVLYCVASICAASGSCFAWLRYLHAPTDEFSAYNHPAQPWALDVHVASSAALTLVLGVVFGAHALPRLASERRARSSGISLLAMAALMIASGALLSCSSQPLLRTALAWTHGVSGTLFVLLVPLHLLVARRAQRAIRPRAQDRGWLRRAPTPRSRTSAAACHPLARR